MVYGLYSSCALTITMSFLAAAIQVLLLDSGGHYIWEEIRHPLLFPNAPRLTLKLSPMIYLIPVVL